MIMMLLKSLKEFERESEKTLREEKKVEPCSRQGAGSASTATSPPSPRACPARYPAREPARAPALPPPQPTDIMPRMPGFSSGRKHGSAERRHNEKIKTGRGKGHTGCSSRCSVEKVGKAGRTDPTCESGHISPTTPPLSCNPPRRNAERRLSASKKHSLLFKSTGSKPQVFNITISRTIASSVREMSVTNTFRCPLCCCLWTPMKHS